MRISSALTCLLGLFLYGGSVLAAERFFVISPADLPDVPPALWNVRLVMDPPAEAYVLDGWIADENRSEPRIAIRTTSDQPPTGRAIQPAGFGQEESRISSFTVRDEPAESAQELFHLARREHYRRLQLQGGPGTAWFRHLADQSEAEILRERRARLSDRWRFEAERQAMQQYDLFTGGRAISENLQLDRGLRQTVGQTATREASIDVDSISGITVAEMDFAALLGDAKPALDPLARSVPADQYAVFFPTFAGLVATLDHAPVAAARATGGLMPLGEEASLIMRYQAMLGIEFDDMVRRLGPTLVKSAAITGSDPFLALGTDIAIVFESPSPTALGSAIVAQITTSANRLGVMPNNQQIAGTNCLVFRSNDRAISSYVAVIGESVVVANSPVQIESIAKALAGDQSLATLPEYQFFRHRYALDGGKESLLLIIPDAAIRKWCSARWRIADARRLQARAVMLDQVAEAISAGRSRPEVSDPEYGTLDFSTPIAELKIDKVNSAESRSYSQWRDGYQRNWRGVFDPIALSLSFAQQAFSADLSVMPLIAGSDYAQFIELTRGVSLAPTSGDPHGALLHFAMAINRESAPVKSFTIQARNMAGLQIDPLAWLGKSVALYVDDDPVWAEIAQDGTGIEQKHIARLPIALRAESTNPLKLATFLTAVRGVIEQTAPGLTRWENFEHAGRPYVRISSIEGNEIGVENFAIYYAALADSLLVTLSEDLMKRSLARAAGPGDPEAQKSVHAPWVGESFALQVTPAAVDIASVLNFTPADAMGQQNAANIRILNEWKRLFPDEDPVAVHQRFWNERVTCPAGGDYVWNPSLFTMESTLLGSPDSSRKSRYPNHLFGEVSFANLGVTFENGGLRARAIVESDPDKLPQKTVTEPAAGTP